MANRSILRLAMILVVAFCVLTTVSLGIFVATNFRHVSQAVQVLSLIRTQAIQEVSAGQLIEGAIQGVVGSLEDPYSAYLDAREYQSLEQHISGTYGGVGLLIGVDNDKRIIVVSPFKGTPAARAGILSGDYILKIDEQETTGMKLDRAASLIQGQPGSTVVLTIFRQGEDEPRVLTLKREIIQIPSVEGEMLKGYHGIGYINLMTFSEHTGRDLGNLLDELRGKGMAGVILDLRSNPGGSLGAAVEVADFFIGEGPIVHIEDRRRSVPYNATPRKMALPLVVLVNEGSASASEIVAGAIKDSGVGVIVGEKTFGKGLVQTVFQLNGGAAVKLTTARYLTPNRVDINKMGIQPDVEVHLDAKKEAEIMSRSPDPQRDPQLAKGVEILKSKMR